MNIEELKRLAEAESTPDDIHELAYELGGTDSGEYHLDPDALDRIIAAATRATALELIAEIEYLRGKNREHFDACIGCDEELKRVTKQRDELLAAAKQAVDRIAYAIYNLADKKLEELPAGIIDSTDPVYSGLIAEKFLRAAITKAEG